MKRLAHELGSWLAALAPGLALLAVSVSRDGIARGGSHRISFVVSTVVSLAGCTLLVRAGGARRGNARFVARAALVIEALAIGMQLFVRTAFQTELDAIALRSARVLGASAFEFLRSQPRGVALAVGLPLTIALGVPLLMARFSPTSPERARRCLLLALPLPFLVALGFGYLLPLSSAVSPDVLLAASLVRTVRAGSSFLGGRGIAHSAVPHERSPLPVPRLTSARPRPLSAR